MNRLLECAIAIFMLSVQPILFDSEIPHKRHSDRPLQQPQRDSVAQTAKSGPARLRERAPLSGDRPYVASPPALREVPLPPSISIQYPAENQTIELSNRGDQSEEPFEFKVDAAPGKKVKKASFVVLGADHQILLQRDLCGTGQAISITCGTSVTFSEALPLPPGSSGEHRLSIQALDSAGINVSGVYKFTIPPRGIQLAPISMVGRPAILASGKLGKLCNYGDPACNKCAVETVAQVSGADALSISRVDTTYQFPLDANWKFKKHVQGITRLPDLKGRGRMVLSENTTNRGIHIAFQDIRGATEAVFSNARLLKDRAPFTLINTRRFGNYDHPGGMQSQGEVVAIAMEGPQNPEKYASIIFLKVEGNGFAFVNQLALDGSRGEPQQDRVNIENANAATVGFVQLDNGRYLTAVAGAQHGTKGIWFYESSNTVLGPETTWKYLDFYRPASVGYGSDMDNNYAGAGGGMNFVTDCTGQIYLFAMTGTDGAGRDDETLQVFEVNRNGNSIELTKVAQQKDSFQLAMNNHSFRWSGSVYITRSGRIAVMNSERREGGRADRGEAVDGDVYIGRPPARTNGRRPGD